MPIVKKLMISGVDSMRLAMPSASEQPKRDHELKRKAWWAVFLVSGLFWLAVALVAWHYWS